MFSSSLVSLIIRISWSTNSLALDNITPPFKQFYLKQKKSKHQLILVAFAVVYFLDLSKAFDTVNHKILLDKLLFYGIRGNAFEWFKSYLSNRKQFVSIGNVNSDVMSITMGVTQSSVIGMKTSFVLIVSK